MLATGTGCWLQPDGADTRWQSCTSCAEKPALATTLARAIARHEKAVFTSLDHYLTSASKVRSLVGPLCVDLLRLGTSVVFDFAGNTPQDRRWVRSLFERAGAGHELHYIPVDEEMCRARIRERNAARPEGLFFGVVTEHQIDEVNRHFVAPSAEEGFTVIVHQG